MKRQDTNPNIINLDGVQLDISQPVELTTELNGHPFVITGDYESLRPIYDEQRAAAPAAVEVAVKRTRAVAKQVGGMVLAPVEGVAERVKVDTSAFMYDVLNGTHFLAAVREKRQTEKDLRMAQKLGILGVDVCAKHRKALEDVKKVR